VAKAEFVLNQAINGVELIPDKTELSNLLEEALLINKSQYTDFSRQALQIQIDAAKKVLENQSATQRDVDDVLNNLNRTINNLDPQNNIEIVTNSEKDIQILKTGESEFVKLVNLYNKIFQKLQGKHRNCLLEIAEQYTDDVLNNWRTLGNTDFAADKNLELFIDNSYSAAGELMEIISLSKYNYESDIDYAIKKLRTCYGYLIKAKESYGNCCMIEKTNIDTNILNINDF
jgi:paraquat-inducible protein B